MKPIKEIPLVLLTLFSQAAIGLSVTAAFFAFLHPIDGYHLTPALPGIALSLLSIGMISSVFHLGHPLGGIRSVANIKVSWLSREIIAFGFYGGALIFDLCLRVYGRTMIPVQIVVTVCGIAALYTSSRIYKNSGYPALDNHIPLLSFSGTAILLGPSLLGCFNPSVEVTTVLGQFILLASILFTGFHFITPFIWSSGNRVMRSTALKHYQSPLFWIRGILLFLVVGISIMNRPVSPLFLLLLIFCEELMGRILFFNHIVHNSDLIGRPYN